MNLPEEDVEDPYIPAKIKDWSQTLKQRASAIGKRIQLLETIRKLMKQFKKEGVQKW